MQKPPSVTLWLGFWLGSASLASEPMKNCPAGISTMLAGQLATGAADSAGAALATGGADVAVAGLVFSACGMSLPPLPRPNAKKPPTPTSATAASAPTISPVLLLAT